MTYIHEFCSTLRPLPKEKVHTTMADYHVFSNDELEMLQSAFLDEIAKCEDEHELEQLSDELDRIEDELECRDLLSDED